MLKITETGILSRSPESSERARPRAVSDAAGSSLGVVHCFVEHEELRRLLSIMAGTELVSEMLQSMLA